MPYLPLYVQDFLTDEKLIECSAESTGVYIRLLCIMHKSQEYGKILLKQKDKQSGSKISDFAFKLSKQMPWEIETIQRALTELVTEGVVTIDGDTLFQKRMVKDGNLSDTRANAGKKGGKKTQQERASSTSSMKFASDFAEAKIQANTENEDEDENESEEDRKEGCRGEREDGDTTPEEGKDDLRNPELGRVMDFYLDKISATPSTALTSELAAYTADLSADVVLHALGVALDERKIAWSYIRAILEHYKRDGLRTLADVQASEQAYRNQAKRQRGGQRFPPGQQRPMEERSEEEKIAAMRRMLEYREKKGAHEGERT